MGEGDLHQQRVHAHGQDVGAREFPADEAVLVYPLGVPPCHLQEIVHGAHAQLVRHELADVQLDAVPVVLAVHLREAPLQLLVDARADVVAVEERGGKEVLGGEGWKVGEG